MLSVGTAVVEHAGSDDAIAEEHAVATSVALSRGSGRAQRE